VAIKYISSAWRDNLKTFPSNVRAYADFEQLIYPGYDDDLTYTVVTSGDNQSGSHNVTGGSAQYLIDLPDTFTLEIKFKPQFAYDVGANQTLLEWQANNSYFTIDYVQAVDQFRVKWKDGGTERVLNAGTTYTSDVQLQVWHTMTMTIDLTTGTTAGSALYIDRSSVDTDWNGNIDSKTSNFPLMYFRQDSTGTAFAYHISYMRFFPNKLASSDDVANGFKDLLDQEIIWHFNGVGIGRSRCNISQYVANFKHAKTRNSDIVFLSNSLDLTLYNNESQFSTEQNQTYDPSLSQYNGTASQDFLKNNFRIEIEDWYENDYELLFTGRIDQGLKRQTKTQFFSTVTVRASDDTQRIAKNRRRYGSVFLAKDLADTTESNSLFHLIARLGTQDRITNYASNSGFENSTISNSWTAGSGATLTRSATEKLFGSYSGRIVTTGGAAENIKQIMSFTEIDRLSVGDIFTASVYILSSSGMTWTLELAEYATLGIKDSTTNNLVLSGGEWWTKVEVTHTITDVLSNRLHLIIKTDDAATSYVDGVMVLRHSVASNWYAENTDDGTAGLYLVDGVEEDLYDTVGFDVDQVDYEHPAVLITEHSDIWAKLKELSGAALAYKMGFDESGTLVLRSRLSPGFSDPSPIETITSTMSMSTVLENEFFNKIVIRAPKIDISTEYQQVWEWRNWQLGAGSFRNYELLTNGESWPGGTSRAWAYFNTDSSGALQSVTASGGYIRDIAEISTSTEITNVDTVKVVAVSDLSARHTSSTITPPITKIAPSDLTISLDTNSRDDAIGIKITNNTGSSRYLGNLSLRGKVTKLATYEDGYVSENRIDYDSIRVDGPKVFNYNNEYIIDEEHNNKVADYYYKAKSKKKHIYQLESEGALYHMSPGEWYTVQIGTPGNPESINATCQLLETKINLSTKDIGKTIMKFIEVEENWQFDSNALTRRLVRGPFSRDRTMSIIVVAASDYTGAAHIYCDGTADDVDIQDAIDRTIIAQGGGRIYLTEGTFELSDVITMANGIVLEGAGEQTVLNKDHAGIGIDCDTLTSIEIRNLKIQLDSARSNTSNIPLINIEDCEDVIMQDCFTDGEDWGIKSWTNSININIINNVFKGHKYCIYVANALGLTIDNNVFDGENGETMQVGVREADTSNCIITNNVARNFGSTFSYGIWGASDSAIIEGNIVKDFTSLNGVSGGIRIDSATNAQISNNTVMNIIDYTSYANPNFSAGISVHDDNNIVTNNVVNNAWGHGILIFDSTANNNIITNNYCIDNGNLIIGADCEGGVGQEPTYDTTVTLVNGTFARSTDVAHGLQPPGSTSASFKITKTAGGSATNIYLQDNTSATDLHGLIPGQQYTFTAWVYVPSTGGCLAGEARITVAYYDSGAWNATNAGATGQDAWEQITASMTIPSTVTGVYVRCNMLAAASAGEIFYVDDLRLKAHGIHNEHNNNFLDNGTGTIL
jgi:parallel beta-helix repeat protein